MNILSRLSLAAILLLAPAFPGAAHEGHDHAAPDPAAQAPSPTAIPTLEADGGDVQLVALLQGGNLTLYIDRLADNSPVTGADVTLSADGGKPLAVPPAADGTYRVAAPWATPGEHALNLTVTGAGVADLLVGTLTVPAPAVAAAPDRAVSLVLAAGTFLAGLVLGAGLLAWRNRRAVPALLLLAVLAVPAQRVVAHEGHDHGAPAAEPVAGNNPRRLPDGSLFVPKATQRLLAVRTMVLATGQVAPMASLTGRVIADPNRSGRVRAPQSGRLMPPEGGFPLPGMRVKAGEVMGYVELVLRAEDGSGISEQLAGLDKDIRLAQQQWNRLSNLKGAVAQAEIDDARATLDGLTRQREALSRAIAKRVPLTAPVDGVVIASNAVPGLMIEDRDVTLVFEIAEPDALLVEALSFTAPPAIGSQITARLGDATFALTLVGHGVGTAPGATRLLLRPQAGTPLTLGSLLSLSLAAGPPVDGVLAPRDALVRGSDGLPAVLLHEGAQRFVPRTVRAEPAGSEHVRLLAGVTAGDRVVVQGAALLAQIR